MLACFQREESQRAKDREECKWRGEKSEGSVLGDTSWRGERGEAKVGKVNSGAFQGCAGCQGEEQRCEESLGKKEHVGVVSRKKLAGAET